MNQFNWVLGSILRHQKHDLFPKYRLWLFKNGKRILFKCYYWCMWGYTYNSKHLEIRRQFENWLSPFFFCLRFMGTFMYVCCLQCWVLKEQERVRGAVFNRWNEWLWAIKRMLGSEPRSSVRALSAFNRWAISPAPSSFPPCWFWGFNSGCESLLQEPFWWTVISKN